MNKRTSWNKGLTKKTDERVKLISEKITGTKRTPEQLKRLSDAHITTGITMYRKFKKNECEICKDSKHILECHHRDKNRHNNVEENIQTLCISYHVKLHRGLL